MPSEDPDLIKANLIAQLTGAVRWTQTIENIVGDGFVDFVEVGGNGRVLSGLIRKIKRDVNVKTIEV